MTQIGSRIYVPIGCVVLYIYGGNFECLSVSMLILTCAQLPVYTSVNERQLAKHKTGCAGS